VAVLEIGQLFDLERVRVEQLYELVGECAVGVLVAVGVYALFDDVLHVDVYGFPG